ncbi:MAG: peptidase [Solibacterales bacterium]|nr:peptidase [Bryobacterales bacterium]|tara:strand:- start:3274 stop:4365 length:1092 start_codon:yes stop_codon:yes gene_type:complete
MHLICGVVAGLVILTMSITGLVLTYEKQIANWADDFEVVPPVTGAAKLSPKMLLTKAQSEMQKKPTAVRLLSEPNKPAKLYFGRESITINPYTGEHLGEGAVKVRGFFRAMIVWHRWLGQDGEGKATGKAITGVCNLAFLFILVSGPYLWWPKQWTWKNLRSIILFRSGLPPKARDFNWHNVIGVWLAIPLFLIAGTGTFFSYSWTNDMLYSLTGEERTQSGGKGSSDGVDKETENPEDFSGLDKLFQRAVAIEPEWTSITVRLADDSTTPVTFSIDRGNGFRPDLRSTLLLDRETGDIVRHDTYDDNKTAYKARRWIRYIHTGEAGGLIGQTLAGVASLGGCLLVYTGLMLSWRRFRAWREK